MFFRSNSIESLFLTYFIYRSKYLVSSSVFSIKENMLGASNFFLGILHLLIFSRFSSFFWYLFIFLFFFLSNSCRHFLFAFFAT
jgi:hypothetical protein